jgi:hypothetical protein
MKRNTTAVLGGIALSLVVGCAGHTGSATAGGGARPSQKTIYFGALNIEPPDLTIAPGDEIVFFNRKNDPLGLEFISPGVQTGVIKCHVTDPKMLEKGEAAWAEFKLNGEGHYVANVPAGPFPSACTFAPGVYRYRVTQIGDRLTHSGPDQEGIISVR